MEFQIITFYEFKRLENLPELKQILKSEMDEHNIRGTILIAAEGFNATIAGLTVDIARFIKAAERIFESQLKYKSSFHSERPFLKAKVRIKREIVALRHAVKIEKGIGTHVSAQEWNDIIADEETIVLDARNDYEVKIGTFRGAINPKTEKFSDLPAFVRENFDPQKHKKIAAFCTGGIRCEKFAPLLVEMGFENVYQLDGGILKYLEDVSPESSLWQGECFVFDDRIAVDHQLNAGQSADLRPLTINPPKKKINDQG